MNNLLAAVVSLIAGIALPFAFAPYELWPLAFVSCAVFFAMCQNVTHRQALVRGMLFGLGYFGFGVYWIYFSVHLFGGAIVPLSIFVTFLFVSLLTVFPVLIAWIYSFFNLTRFSVFSAVIFASVWSALELLRGWLFGGFPWLLVGYSQIDTVFSGYAPVFGVYGIGWLVVFCASLVMSVLFSGRRLTRVPGALLLAVLCVAAAVLNPIEWSTPKDTTLAMRLVQGNIKQEMKFSRERLESSLQTYAAMSRAAPADTQVVVWPETAIPTYFDRVDNVLAPFVQEMEGRGAEILSGGFHRDENGQSYNSFRQLGGDKALYNKRHLVPFGEFMPFRFILDHVSRFIVIPMSDLTAGTGPVTPLAIHGEQLGISICYEDVFGEEMRASLPASTVLVNVSNDAWFGDSSAPHQHQEMARMRAREFSRPLMRVTNTGITSAITHRGEVTDSIPQMTAGALDLSVTPRTGATPYVALGNLPVIGLNLVLLLVGYLTTRSKKS